MGTFLKTAGLYLVKAGIWLAGHPEVFELVKALAPSEKEK